MVLVALGCEVGRKKVRVVMRAMGLWPICPKPKTSLRAPDHKVYPYLLRSLTIERLNQVSGPFQDPDPIANGLFPWERQP